MEVLDSRQAMRAHLADRRDHSRCSKEVDCWPGAGDRPGYEEVAIAAAWEVASVVIITGVVGALLDEEHLHFSYQSYS